jgi:putative DNA primase/helicase
MDKPARIEILYDNIPQELKALPQWCLWKWEQRDKRWTKPPYQLSGDPAKSNDPATWSTFQDTI